MVAAGVAGRRWRAIGILLVLLACIAGTTLLGMMFVPSLTHALLWTTVGRQCPLHPTRPHSGIVP
jgi:hypothetical protein